MAVFIPELTIRSAPGGKGNITVEQRIADLEQRLAKLESVVKLQADGSLRIESNNMITIKASWIKIEALTNLELRGRSHVEVKGDAIVEVRSDATLKLRAAQTLVDGSPVVINGGKRLVARKDDQVTVNGPYASTGQVALGSSTVLVP